METVIYGLREDRWQRCLNILDKYNFKEVTRFIPTIDRSDLYRNANRELIGMLSERKGDMMFFEDDFELTDNWQEVLEKAQKDLPSTWDVLYLGANLTSKPIRVTPNLIRLKGQWMLHGVIFRYEFIRYILKEYTPTTWAFDQWMSEQSLKRKFYMTYPMVCYQRPDWSDYQNQKVDYRIFKNKFYERL